MASVYTNDLRLEEIGSGEQSGTWGDTTNTNLELIAEAFSFGTEAITTNADTHTTTIADGASDPGRSLFLKYTGTLDSACTITIAPNTVSKLWFIENGTSGSQNIIISQGSGANITIPPGDTKAIYSDGAGSGAAVVDAFASLSVVDLKVQDDLTVTDDVSIGGTLTVTGDTTFNGDTATFTSANSDDPIVIIKNTTNNAASAGLKFIKDKGAAGADGDDIGQIDYVGDNAAQEQTTFVSMLAEISTAADGAEGGKYSVRLATHDGEMQTGLLLQDGNAEDEIDVTIASGTSSVTTIAGTLTSTGVVTANAGVVVDEMTLDADTLTATDTFTIDAVDDITLNSDNSGRILFGDASVIYGIASNSSSDFVLEVGTSDKDMLFKGQDGGASITALTLDMSEAGTATFNHDVKLPSGGNLFFTSGSSFSPRLSNSNSDTALSFFTNNTERFQIATDGGLHVLTPGTSNVRLGVNAGDSITSGTNYNVCIGDEAGTALNGGDNNTAVGYQALATENANSNNTAIGHQALKDQDGGDGNTAVGANALENLTNASRCTAVGNSAGLNSAGADDVVFIGHDAGKFATTATNSVFIGSQAGQGVGATPLTGNNNTVVGESAGLLLQGTATLNTLLGCNAGAAQTTVSNNTFIGAFAGDSATSGDNTGVGSGALGGSLTGDQNTAVGHDAGNGLTSGTDNVMIGHLAGVSATSTEDSTLVGEQAGGGAVMTGNKNTLIGRAAGYAISSGAGNLMLGVDAGRANSPAGNQTTGSGTVCLGDDNISDLFCADTSISSSDSRDKADITDFSVGLNWIKDLRPVTYKWDKRSWYGTEEEPLGTPDGSKKKSKVHIGFIAQEVLEIEKANGFADSKDTMLTCNLTEDDQRYGMKYERLVPILVNAIKELSAKVETLETKVTALEG